MATYPKKRRFTAAEYHQMAQAGILDEDDRLELINGEIVEMTPIGRRHVGTVNRLTSYFVQRFGGVAVVSVQNPVQLGEHSEPQPDLALLRSRADFYAAHLPNPEDVYLLVEVAETSVEPDRRVKVPLYARSGIPELWLVDLEQETITVYRDPSQDGYRTVRVMRRGEQIAPAALPDLPLDLAILLG